MEPTKVRVASAAENHAIFLLKTASDAIKVSGKSEGLQALIDLQTVMLELIQQRHEQVLEIVQLRETIKQFEQEKQRAEHITFDGSSYWKTIGDRRDGPYCQVCYDKEGKMSRLRVFHGTGVNWRCNICQNTA
jgi:hypothetical protein